MPNISFVFQGQGSQYSGMGKDFYESFASSRDIYQSASEYFNKLKDFCFDEKYSEELNKTINTQPCMFVTEYSMASALMKTVKPYSIAGFSLGEITALCVGGCFGFNDGLSLILKRALFMEEAVGLNETSMVACLKLSDDEVKDICSKYENIYPVNYNCDGQVVVAGLNQELEKFCYDVKSLGASALKLNVSGAFHSPFMNIASEKMRDFLKGFSFSSFEYPVYSNVNAKRYSNDFNEIKYNISNQINSPVLWKDIVKNMIQDGTDIFIEIGPSKTLSKFIKKINPSVEVFSVDSVDNLNKTLNKIEKFE